MVTENTYTNLLYIHYYNMSIITMILRLIKSYSGKNSYELTIAIDFPHANTKRPTAHM